MTARAMLAAAVMAAVIAADVGAAPVIIFDKPDAPLPGQPGAGLAGTIWAGIPPGIDDLAAAAQYAAANQPSARFLASTVSFPKGGSTIGTDSTFGALLGADAMSLSPDISATVINNSILRFTGFFAAPTENFLTSFWLGSDDGSRLDIQGLTIIDNDRVHAFPGGGAGPADVLFALPGLYAIDILFFESEPVGYGVQLRSAAGGDPVETALLFAPEPQAIGAPVSLLLFGVGLVAGLGLGAKRSSADG
jgi:hypothetical protein